MFDYSQRHLDLISRFRMLYEPIEGEWNQESKWVVMALDHFEKHEMVRLVEAKLIEQGLTYEFGLALSHYRLTGRLLKDIPVLEEQGRIRFYSSAYKQA